MAQEQNNKWNVPMSGLNKDSAALDNTAYSHLMNGNFETLEGGTYALTNEMSNILSSKFKAGFKVIGFKNDIVTASVYFFLVNPATNVGEFGVIKDVQNVVDLRDIASDCPDCKSYYEMAEKLEDIAPEDLIESQTYTTLLTDACNWDEGEALNLDVFNFSVNHPIRSIVIKNEKCGKVMYFTDNLNSPRYIELDNIEFYTYKGSIVCGVDEREFGECPQASYLLKDADKLLIFKKFDIPTLSPSSIILGGNLKMGVYSFLLAYCNELGQEISEYYSLTTPIPIFDENNNILAQEDLASRTNFGIKLAVTGLDQRYEYYKVVVAQTASLDAATVYYEEGLYPINNTTITYTTEQNKKAITIDVITKINLKVEKTEGLTTSNNSLFQYGITNKKEINLQPIVNLLGGLLQWQTHVAPENLYQDGVNVSKFLGYNRDEAVPFGIKFYSKGGYETKILPFIGRPALAGDKDLLVDEEGNPVGDGVDNLDVSSILERGDCVEVNRRERWQFYNTAQVSAENGGFCANTGGVETKAVVVQEEVVCYVEDVATIQQNTLVIDIDDTFIDFETYLQENQGDCASFSSVSRHKIGGTSGSLNVSVNGVIYTMSFSANIPTTILNFVTTHSGDILTATGSTISHIVERAVTLTGTSGTANIIVGGVNYISTFTTDLTTTAANFVTDHAGAILTATGTTVTSTGADIIFTDYSNSFPTLSVANVTVDLAGTVGSFVGVGEFLVFSNPLPIITFSNVSGDLDNVDSICDILSAEYNQHCAGISNLTFSGVGAADDELEINGVSYSLEWDTDIATTLTKFVTDHASAINTATTVTVTSSDNTLIFSGFVTTDFLPSTLSTLRTCDKVERVGEGELEVSDIVFPEGDYQNFLEKDFVSDYTKIIPPKSCVVYRIGDTGGYLQDVKIQEDGSPYYPMGYFPVTFDDNNIVPLYERDSDFTNESCGFSEPIVNIQSPSATTSSYFNNYYIKHNSNVSVDDEPDPVTNYTLNSINYEYGYYSLLQGFEMFYDVKAYVNYAALSASPGSAGILYIDLATNINYYWDAAYIIFMPSSIKDMSSYVNAPQGFYKHLSKGALWFKGDIQNRDKFIFEIGKERDSTGADFANYGGWINEPALKNTIVRISLFDRCNSTLPVASYLVNMSVGEMFLIEKTNTNTVKITRETAPLTPVDTLIPWFTQNDFFVSVEDGIFPRLIDIDSRGTVTFPLKLNFKWRWVWMVCPTDGCYTVTTRDIEYKQLQITWESITFRKRNTYSTECTYRQPILKGCTAIPYKKGEFAYIESEVTYPDNELLFNSVFLESEIEELLNELDAEEAIRFTNMYLTEGNVFKQDGGKSIADFTCRPIRHFRFPDNKVAPFMQNTTIQGFSSSTIYPLGVTIKESTIHAFLDYAVKFGILSQEDREAIFKYEIVRGDLNTDRSVIASGLLYDMREYKEKNKTILYSNYPFNSYSEDKLNLNLGEEVNTDFGEVGDNFTFHSPESDYYKSGLPTELSVQGYMFGKSSGYFDEVKDHPKWVILSKRARNLAGILAGLEVAVQIAVNAATYAEVYRFQVGLSNAANPVGIGLAIGASAIQAINSIITDYGRLRYEWLKIFRDLGKPNNFANYYYAEGNYNYLSSLQTEGNSLRNMQVAKYLNQSRQQTTNEYNGQIITVNNIDREKSVLISLGDEFGISYPDTYKQFDKISSSASITFLGENGALPDEQNGKSNEVVKNIASPYAALKNYLPSQHGEINSVRWITTGFRRELGEYNRDNNSCLSVFGGDTFISRHTLKRKIPLFLTTAMGTANMTPFNYYYYNNIGTNPRFYCSYELNKDFERSGKLFPDIDSDYVFDTPRTKGNYIVPPSKFYLYYYGVPNFLTESRINTNFRYAERMPAKQFYPQVGDLGDWTQESKISIKEPNHFFYNNVYSSGTFYASLVNYHNVKNQMFATTYNAEFDNCKTDFPNGVIYSLPDVSENSKVDPWLIYRPLDFYEFPASNGKLKNLQSIESGALLARFENTSVIYNKVDSTVDDGRRPEATYLGGSSVFSRRPVTSAETDIGFGGTQSSQSISTEFGHFHVDVMRGQVMFLPSYGSAMQEISAILQGKTTYMRHWFKSHLPFKILKSGIEGIDKLDTDNGINGIGIVLGWDSRFRRLFITKKDYVPRPMPVGTEIVYHDSNFYARVEEVETVISLHNNTYFEEVSFTIAYSPVEQKWIGYYDFKPNYYIAHQNYFQTGINDSSDVNEFGLWSHILTNKSYQVFYGKFYPFTIEYQMRRSAATIAVQTLTWDVDVVRYHNEFDFSDIAQKGFNKLWVYGSIVNSGELWLDPNTGGIDLISSYPKTDKNGKYQRILVTSNMKKYSANYFYNRVQRHSTNTPIWYWDRNQIDKTLNKAVIKFSGKNVLEVLRSNMFSVRLSQDHESRLKYTFHLASSKDQEK